MSIDSPTGILDIRNATLKVSKLEVTNATGFDTALNNIARNTILLVDSTEQTASNSWALKLPNAWVGEFEGYWASGATGDIDFNFYNNTTSGTNGYTLSMDDTTIVVKYDGVTLQTTTISSTLKTSAYRKVSILFERDTISMSIDGSRELYFKDSTLRSRVYDDEAGGYITVGGLDSTNRKFKNLKVVNEKWISDGTSNIAYMGGNVGVGVAQPTSKFEVAGTAAVSSNLEVGTANLFVDTTTGNVGIGVTDPNFVFEIINTGNADGIRLTNPGYNTLTICNQLGNDNYNSLANTGDCGIIFNTDYNTVSGASTGLVICPHTASGTNGIKIRENGQVGINKDPSYNLDVAGNLYVSSGSVAYNFSTFGSQFGGGIYFTGDITDAHWHICIIGSYNLGFRSPSNGSYGTVSYISSTGQYVDSFTGQHNCLVDTISHKQVDSYEGLIVCADKNEYISLNGELTKNQDAVKINEALPILSLSKKSQDKSCFGVISSSEDEESREQKNGAFVSVIHKEYGDTRIFVNSLGEGAIWVIDSNGSLESGDYITTSNVIGYGQRQDSEFLANYTVAKITMDCDFNPPTRPIKRIKKVMDDVTYYLTISEQEIEEITYKELKEHERLIETKPDYYLYKYYVFDNFIKTPEEYDVLEEDEKTKYTKTNDIKKPEEYDVLEESEKSKYTKIEKTIFFKVSTEKTRFKPDKYDKTEIVRELVPVIDDNDHIVWEDDPSGATEKAYKIRYLDANGNITDEANHVYKAAFVGCTYHCG